MGVQIDTVGDPHGLSVAMKALLAGPFKDREVRIAVRVELLTGLAALASKHEAEQA